MKIRTTFCDCPDSGFMNHTLTALTLLTSTWLFICVPGVAELLEGGTTARTAAFILLAAGLISPWVLAFRLEAGYADNGCLGAILIWGGYGVALWAARRFGAESPIEKAIALAVSVAAPWVFYGGIRGAEYIEDRRMGRKEEEKEPGANPPEPE